ncbi:MAG: DUF58 domain-containing protein [Anaerolineae bacterium]
MKRLRLPSLLIYSLVILGFATLQGHLLILAIPFILYLGVGFLHRPETLELRASRTLSADRVARGVPIQVKLCITNQGPPLENLLLEDLIPPGLEVIDGEWRALTALQSGETIELEYTLRGQRGFYRLPGVRATAREHLGLFSKQIRLELPNQVFILPQLHRLPQVAIRPQRTRVFAGTIPARKGGPGVDFYGVREYQPGDPLRWINHRASARYAQALFVNEFEQERAADVGLILDIRQVTNLYVNQSSMLEYAIEAAATLADAFLNRGNRVGLFLYGGSIDWTYPGYGKVQRERVLQALSRATLQKSQVFEKLAYLPTRLFPIRSQLVLVSPLRPADLDDLVGLRARGYQLLVISPDPVAFEAEILASDPYLDLAVRVARLERAHLFHQLQQVGIRIFEWQVSTPFHRIARHALRRMPFWGHDPRGR